jgi:transposase InsO family protein
VFKLIGRPIYQFIHLNVSINGQLVEAFIDTGSTITLMSAKLQRFLRLPIIDKTSISIKQLDGITHSIGRVNTILTLAHISKPLNIHVLPHFQYPLLLGLDAGKEFGLHLDLSSSKVSICDKRVPNKYIALHLSLAQSNALSDLLIQNHKVFSNKDSDIGRIKIVKHTIHTVPHPPIQLKPYRRNQSDYEEIKRQISQLIKVGHIRESSSPWAFPVTLADKSDGSKRLCIDFRRLNQITIDDKMPMPRISEVLDRLKGSRFFTTLDIAWGFWHIEMDDNSVEKTAFVTNEGHYEWLVMPFGLKNAPATFQRIIQRILGPLLYKGVINYLDDFILYTETYEEHLELLNKVLCLLIDHNIKLKREKCFFAKTEVTYLGHVVSHNQVKPSPQKTAAIHGFPTPTTLTSVRRFLGMTNWYRKFVDNYTRIAKPLTLLQRKDIPFHWGPDQTKAFIELKNAITSDKVLALYDPEKPCILYTDASLLGIGAALHQIDDKGVERPIEFYSRRLDKHHQNYSASELECFAVIEAIKHFDVYLNQHFTIITDHSALQWLLSHRQTKGRLFKWSQELSTRSCTIKHKSGKQQMHVDALSRAAISLHISTDELSAAQTTEDMSFVRNPILRQNIVTIKHKHRYKAVVPQTLRHKLLKEFHDDFSHPGKTKTIRLISDHYWWPDVIKEVKQYVSSCKTCQMTKYSSTPTPGHYVCPSVDLKPNDLISIDTIVMGPSAKNTSHKYIQVFIDHHSRYLWAFPTRTNTAETIITLLTNIFKSGVRIKRLLTDCHKCFTSTKFKNFCQQNGIKHSMSTPYHPQTQGIVERANGIIITKLRAELFDKPNRKWSTLLPKIIDNTNNTLHDITGFSPKFLYTGSDDTPDFASKPMPIEEARSLARIRTHESQLRRKHRNDNKHQNIHFDVGDRVLRRVPDNHPTKTKITPRWTGPYYVITTIGEVTYDIADTPDGNTSRAHVSQLKKFIPREQTAQVGENETNN